METVRRVAAALLVVLASSCGGETESVDSLELVATWMSGSFSSHLQAEADSDDFHIRLHHARIWPERTDGPWLYVEQAGASSPEEPYRQRVYRLVAAKDGVVESRVYELPDPQAAVGGWKTEAPLADLEPSALRRMEGCTVFLRRQDDGSYSGATEDAACLTTWGGATYATSEVTVREDEIVSWDRGYDADGQQVWGAVKGGYTFRKD